MIDIVKRVNKLRKFPHNTTPASRHVEFMAECLMRGEKYALLDEEPAYCAEAIYAVLAGFYENAAEVENLRAQVAALREALRIIADLSEGSRLRVNGVWMSHKEIARAALEDKG